MKKLDLVTGGCGFVGRHLVAALLARGRDVYVVDNLSTGKDPEGWLPAGFRRQPANGAEQARRYVAEGGQCVQFVHGDLLASLLRQLELAAKGAADGSAAPSTPARWPKFADVYHLASIVGGRHVIDGDPLHVSVDLAIDALFFRWLTVVPGGIERVLYASSSAAYPINLQQEGGHVALREDMLQMGAGKLGQPDMTYGFSKMTGEYLAHLAAERYGLHVACVRPFSGYGEDQETAYPVPAIASRVAAGESPVTVWGTGEQGRDFVHIDDCIEAILRAIERISDGSAVNIGTGKLTTFLELAGVFLQLDGRPNDGIKPLVDKPVGVSSRYCDPAQMRAVLNFSPRISLEEGMGRVLRAAHARLETKPSRPRVPASRGPSSRAERQTSHADSGNNLGSAP